VKVNPLVRKLFPLLANDINKEMIAGVINRCTKNEQIDDDSRIIISNVLPNINFHNDTYSPEKKRVTSGIS
jgi:hypothetical protein